MRRNYSNTAVATTLAAGITDSDVSLTVADATGYPDAPFTITIGSEVILVGERDGTTFSALTRGYDGTVAAAHDSGAAVEHTVVAEDVRRVAPPWLPGYQYGPEGHGDASLTMANDTQEAAALLVPRLVVPVSVSIYVKTPGSSDGQTRICLWDDEGRLIRTWGPIVCDSSGTKTVLNTDPIQPGGYLIGIHSTGYTTPPAYRAFATREALFGMLDGATWAYGGYKRSSVSMPADFTGTERNHTPPRVGLNL